MKPYYLGAIYLSNLSITLLYKNDLILIAIHGTDQRISEERDRKNLHKTQS